MRPAATLQLLACHDIFVMAVWPTTGHAICFPKVPHRWKEQNRVSHLSATPRETSYCRRCWRHVKYLQISSSYCLTILTSVQKSKDNKDITTQVPRWKMDPLPLWILMAPDLSICRSVDLLTGPAAGWPGCKDRRRPRES